MLRLSDCKVGDKVIVKNLLFEGKLKDRMLSIGLVKDTVVEVVRNGPKNNLTILAPEEVRVILIKTKS